MFEIISQIAICLIIAGIIGMFIGYIIGKSSCQEKSKCSENTNTEPLHTLHIDTQENQNTTSKATVETKVPAKKEASIGIEPTLLKEARKGEKDNLQLIKGVGKVLEKVLNDTGIFHFDQIANLSKEEATWLDKSVAFPGRIEREQWISQAKNLAENKTTEFAKRVEKGEVPSSKKL